MTEFEYKRLNYIIKQAQTGTFVMLNKGDADILSELLKKYNDEQKWEETVSLVREQLKEHE